MRRRPKPGKYADVPLEEYLAWPYLDFTGLGPAFRSGRHYLAAMGREQTEPTEFMCLGTLVHWLTLEPDRAAERYVVRPDFAEMVRWDYKAPEKSSEYKAIARKWEREHRGMFVVTADQLATAKACAVNLLDVLREEITRSEVELSLVANWPERAKIRLKARVDILSDRVVDVKTCPDASKFERSISQWGYHRQAAIYQDIVELVTGRRLPVWFVVVETEPPHCVREAELEPEWMEQGRCEVNRAIRVVARGMSEHTWTGYPKTAKFRRQPAVELTVNGELVEL